MTYKDKKIIADFKKKLSSNINKRIKKIIVFGSRVKEEGTDDSDLDIAVLIDKRNPDVIEYLEDCAYQVMWDNDFKPIISLKIFVESEFIDAANRGFSFYGNVLKEGISV